MASNGQCACVFPRDFSNAEVVGTVTRVFKTEFLKLEDGLSYTRRHICGTNTNQWKQVSEIMRPATPPPDKSLWVVRQRQPGKNPHWSLFAAVNDDSDSPRGRVWQVMGDPDVGMRYVHRERLESGVGIQMFLTASFADELLVCNNLSEHWEAKVDKIANTVKPPAPDVDQLRKSDCQRGTCKTWVWQVLDELVKEGIVSHAAAEQARNLPDIEPLQ